MLKRSRKSKQKTRTDDEMKVRLESMGYNVTDNEGEVASMSEGYKWDDEQEVWHN